MRTQSFHNTINISGETLEKAETESEAMERKIRDYFHQHPNQYFTPIKIWKTICPERLLTSVRRSITNLADREIYPDTRIFKSEHKQKEMYGRDNFLWGYIPKTNQLEFF